MSQCRIAPSLGALEGHPNDVWGTTDYVSREVPTVFFGLYDLRDYIALWRHRGKCWVLWAGSDIRHLRSRFIFNDGKLLTLSQLFASLTIDFRQFLIKYVLTKAEHWVENEAEAWQLKNMGIKVSGIQPSFMGDVKKYKVSFQKGNKVWMSANRGREQEYGWHVVLQLAWALPAIEFHLYGSDWPDIQELLDSQGITWKQYHPNVFVHGRVSKKKMNAQVQKMQCGLRLNKHDGFSEVTAKSVLWGQYPITYLYHDHITQYADNTGITNTATNLRKLRTLLEEVCKKEKPNLVAREFYIKQLNRYPWTYV